ncbi:ferredoxin [Amycolatopsis antarctica]|uniref:Cytochrome bc1 complex Rieske iron-sulfur subunit n=1 Tax=Amycolatopsis antarctica TaxID=1854586 RepID=A0A263D605_9PSEU|nr:Rieske (2Fe-2S) protein [Amycolatopsis antarctica]OZM73017.1 ferredoxin [Amycolatopsis antarctica]
MAIHHGHTRRTVLTTGAAAALGVTALTACGPEEPAAPAAAAPGSPLAALADIPVGEAKLVAGPDEEEIVLARPTETTAAAFSASCTHQGCKVKAEGKDLTCPCHGSVFDALTGAVRTGPATEPLPPIAVSVREGQIVSGA